MIKERTLIEPIPTIDQDQYVASLDPLKLDRFLAKELPVLNSTIDTTTLRDRILEISNPFGEFNKENLSLSQARAITRDCSFMFASLVRWGLPVNRDLENMLARAAEITGENPLYTIVHYADWNPEGPRIRTFTGTENERLFIKCLQKGNRTWKSALKPAKEAHEMALDNPGFVVAIEKVNLGLLQAKDAMLAAKIFPKYFTLIIKPYFPDLTFNGVDYPSPSGTQSNNLLLERMIWGLSAAEDLKYQSYYEKNVGLLPKEQQLLAESIKGKSIVDRVIQAVENGELVSPMSLSVVAAIRRTMLSISSFHYPHMRVAEKNFRLRGPSPHGSGGLAKEDLMHLGDLRQEYLDKVDELYVRISN